MTRRLPAELGEVIGGYRLDELVNRGGMGAVYKATHAVLGRLACVKVLERSLAADDVYVARFLKEAKIVNDVSHENIVDIFDFVQVKNPRRVACIMEYIHGRPLSSVLAQGALTALQSANAMLQLIDALRAVHAKGVVHRDLKPSNIMVVAPLRSDFSVRPAVKILDFGIAKVEDSNAVKTDPGAMLGTPAYMAPEQIIGDKVTPATDVYALGEVFYDMLTGHRVFPGTNGAEIIKLKLLGAPPRLRVPNNVVSPELVGQLLERCLASDPAERPSLQEIESILVEIGRRNEAITKVDPAQIVPAEVSTTPAVAVQPQSQVRKMGDYYCFEELPARGMTQSFVARQEGRVEICVLKRLFSHLEENPTAVARFGREAKILQHLDHPRLAKMYDASIQEGTLAIASEFIIGQPLDAIFDRALDVGKRIPLQVIAPIALGVLDGLAYAHGATDEAGRPLAIVHRDLTPNAIMVAFSGDVKVRDFGIARASVDDFKTSPGMAVGSIEYMSPEQARSAPIDHRSDIYTFSAVLYEALAQRPVVRPGSNLLDTLKSVTGDRPPPLAQVRPDLGPNLAAAIERGLEKDPAQRWQNAAEYREELRASFGKFANASLDVVGDFLRELMPEEELRATELLGKIREAGELLPPPRSTSKGPVHEPTMTVRRRKDTAEMPAPQEYEPSVMTMPGAPAPLERGTAVSKPTILLKQRKRSPLVWIGAAALLAALALVGATSIVREKKQPVEPVAKLEPPAPAIAPMVAPKQEEAPKAPEPPPPPVQEAKPVRKAVPKKAAPPVVEPPAVPPPSPPAPASNSPLAGIRRQLAQLRANPKDVKLFDQLLASIASASRDLPADGKRRVKVDLDAAERTYDVELLSGAVDKLAIESSKSK